VKVQDHHEFSQLDHRRRPRPNLVGGYGRRRWESPEIRGAPQTSGRGANQGIFSAHNQGVFTAH
jgi:hypothetical protein